MDQENSGQSRDQILNELNGFIYMAPLSAPGQPLYHSPSIAKLLGVSVELAMTPGGIDYTTFIHPDDLPLIFGCLQSAAKEGRGWDVDYRLNRTDGRVIWVRDRCEVNRDAHGTPTTFGGFVVEITERKSAELTLAARNKDLTALSDAILKGTNRILKVLGSLRMLGLNARIEAARAGTAGLGFSIVAQELGSLSKETIEATESIAAASTELANLQKSA
jgi:PAS domain S-box-containing protein